MCRCVHMCACVCGRLSDARQKCQRQRMIKNDRETVWRGGGTPTKHTHCTVRNASEVLQMERCHSAKVPLYREYCVTLPQTHFEDDCMSSREFRVEGGMPLRTRPFVLCVAPSRALRIAAPDQNSAAPLRRSPSSLKPRVAHVCT
jgi:hypothetical protein